MKTKRAIFLSWLATLTVGASLAFAAPHGGSHGNRGGAGQAGAGHASQSLARGSAAVRQGGVRPGINRYAWHGGHWRRWYHGGYYFGYNNFAFYPWWGWGYPYAYYYPYGYGPYYPYGYYHSYNEPVYGNGYTRASVVVELQQRLATEGYYHEALDGIAGPATRRAIRAYEHAHGLPVDGRLSRRLLERMDLR
jgi:Putative peptidoglycan binding domain